MFSMQFFSSLLRFLLISPVTIFLFHVVYFSFMFSSLLGLGVISLYTNIFWGNTQKSSPTPGLLGSVILMYFSGRNTGGIGQLITFR
jgi:hypothetical protein